MSPILQSLANGSARGYGAFVPLGAAGSYESIASASGTGSSGTITFSSIPSTYQSLQIRGISRGLTSGTTTENLQLRINGDTGANYTYHYLQGDGSAASASGSTGLGYVLLPRFTCKASVTADTLSAMIIDIHNYANTSQNKTVRYFGGLDANTSSAEFRVSVGSSLWLSTSAITSLDIISGAGNFTTSTTFALYGIKGA